MKINKSKLMKKAWDIARKAMKNFGGKVREYLSESLRTAWSIMKMRTQEIVQTEKHLEILKTWIDKAEKFFDNTYREILSKDVTEVTNKELIQRNAGVMLEDEINMKKRKLKKMEAGKIMSQKVLRDIEALETATIK